MFFFESQRLPGGLEYKQSDGRVLRTPALMGLEKQAKSVDLLSPCRAPDAIAPMHLDCAKTTLSRRDRCCGGLIELIAENLHFTRGSRPRPRSRGPDTIFYLSIGRCARIRHAQSRHRRGATN